MEQNKPIAIVILRALSPEETAVLKQKLTAKNYHIYSNEPQYVASLSENNPFQALSFKSVYESSYEESFRCILEASSVKIGKRTLADLLATENAYWWFYIRFMLLYKHRAAIYALKLIEFLKKELKEEQIEIYHDSGILNEFCKKPFVSHLQPAKKSPPRLKNIFNFVFSFMWRAFMGIFQIKHLFKKYPYILLSNAQANQPVIRSSDLQIVGGDHFTEYLQDRIAKNASDILNLSESFPPKLDGDRSFKLTRQLLFARYPRTLNLEFILLLNLFNPFVYLRAWPHIKALKESIKVIKEAELPIEHALITRYIPSYKRLLFFLILRREILKTFGTLSNAEAIGGTNEHDARVKSILDIARQKGVKTFGIQHGVVHPKHMQYIFQQKDWAYQPYPDTTYLWGDYWKTTLTTDSAYQPMALKSIGQIRTDIIPRLKSLKKSDLLEQLKNDRPVVMYPSQPLYEGEQQMRIRLAKDFLRLTLDFPEVQFIIKPHPWENDYKAFFNQLAQEMGTKNFLFANTDLYKTLAISDIVIVYNSTVGGEAAYFQKPLIVMDYANNDFSGFIRSGIGLGTHQYKEVKTTLHKLLNDELQAPIAKQKAFVEARAFKIDGDTAQRYIEEIRVLKKAAK